jgi:hypothetical protein
MRSIAVKDAIRAVVIIMVGILFIKAYLQDSLKKNLFLGIIIVLAFLDIFSFGYKYNSGKVDPELYWEANRAVNFFKAENQKELIRVNVRAKEGLILPRNIGYVQEFATTDGYNPLGLQRYQKASQVLDRDRFFTLMNVKYKTGLDSATNRLTIQPRDFYLPRAKLFYNWEIKSNADELLNSLNNPEFGLDKTVILEQPLEISSSSDSMTAGIARVVTYSLNKITVDVTTEKPAVLMLSENYFPNWLVKINGVVNKTIPVDYFLRGCVVPTGNSQVEFFYQEKHFSVLFIVSLLTILLSIIFIVLRNLFKFKESNIYKDGRLRSK